MAKRNRPARTQEIDPREEMWIEKGFFVPGLVPPFKAPEEGWYTPASFPSFDRKEFRRWAKGTAVCVSA